MGGVLARRDCKGSGEHERTMRFLLYDFTTLLRLFDGPRFTTLPLVVLTSCRQYLIFFSHVRSSVGSRRCLIVTLITPCEVGFAGLTSAKCHIFAGRFVPLLSARPTRARQAWHWLFYPFMTIVMHVHSLQLSYRESR